MSESEEKEENQERNTEETSLIQEEHSDIRTGTKRQKTTEKINQEEEEESGGEGAKIKKFTKLFGTRRSLRSRGKSIILLIVRPPYFCDHIFKQHSKSPYFFSHQFVTFILKRLVILSRNLVLQRMFLW